MLQVLLLGNEEIPERKFGTSCDTSGLSTVIGASTAFGDSRRFESVRIYFHKYYSFLLNYKNNI